MKYQSNGFNSFDDLLLCSRKIIVAFERIQEPSLADFRQKWQFQVILENQKSLSGGERMEQSLIEGERLKEETLEVHLS